MKVLVTAYSCEPDKGSEPGAGWNLVRNIAQRHEVCVVTRTNNEPSIRAELARRPVPSLRFAYHDLPRLLPLKKLPGGVWWYHYAWHMSLGPRIRQLHADLGFDLSHQLTIGSYRFPGVLHRLGIPTIVGPVGGAEEPPFSFFEGMGPLGSVTEALRWTANRFTRMDPFLGRTLRSADLVLAVSPETHRAVRRIVGDATRVGLLPQSGIDPTTIPLPARDCATAASASNGCAALHVARLEGWKGAHLAIAAVAEARRRGADVRLTILGKGPRRRALERLARQHRVTDSIQFIDRLPSLDDVFACYRRHDVFLFPSLRESGGMALLEALASGLPGIALRIGGPAVSLTEETGFLVPADRPTDAVSAMADALCRLAEDPVLRARMGDAAARRVRRHYAWEPKANALERFYVAVREGTPVPTWSA